MKKLRCKPGFVFYSSFHKGQAIGDCQFLSTTSATFASDATGITTPMESLPLVVGGIRAKKKVAYWLFGCTRWVFSMVALGGVTRLTKSGLSTTDWKFRGSFPPLSLKEWGEEFEKYKKSPEYQWSLEQSNSLRNVIPYSGIRQLSSDSLAAQLPSTTSSNNIGKRFYKMAHVKSIGEDGEYAVMLDNKVLKTPAKKVVKVPSASLAMAIAAEWEAQGSLGIRPYTMPLMKLATITIDQIPQDKERIISSLLNYFHTDAICCRTSDPFGLSAKQAEVWDPLLDWTERVLGARPTVSSSLFVTNQPDSVVQVLENVLRNKNDWELATVDSLAGAARSLIIALAVSHGQLSIEEALKAMRVEEDYQMEAWGLVEGGHDIDMADLHVRVSAACLFLKLLSADSIVQSQKR